MATIHIRDLEQILKERGYDDAQYVIEIRFDEPGRESKWSTKSLGTSVSTFQRPTVP